MQYNKLIADLVWRKDISTWTSEDLGGFQQVAMLKNSEAIYTKLHDKSFDISRDATLIPSYYLFTQKVLCRLVNDYLPLDKLTTDAVFRKVVSEYLGPPHHVSNTMNTLTSAVVFKAEDLVRDLITQGFPVDKKHENGKTGFILAAETDQENMLYLLLENGADIHVSDNNGDTALHWAAYSNNVDMVERLIGLGLDFHKRNANDRTPILSAIHHNAVDVVRYFMRNNSCIYTLFEEHESILHVAMDYYWDCAVVILETGLDPNIKAAGGLTPLHKLADSKIIHTYEELDSNMHLIKLLKHGANINAQDDHGRTPLSLAYRKGKINYAMQLLYHGASMTIKDSADKTPYDYATE